MTGEDERIEMEIRKRNGKSVPFQQDKIFNAMKKAFDGQGREIAGGELEEILATVLDNLSVTVPLTVERVQDEVERTLMERGHYEVAKAYAQPYGGHDGDTYHVQRTKALPSAFKLLCGHCAGQSGRHLPLAGQLRKGL